MCRQLSLAVVVSVKEHVQLETTRGTSHTWVSAGWRGVSELDMQDEWGFLGDHVVSY